MQPVYRAKGGIPDELSDLHTVRNQNVPHPCRPELWQVGDLQKYEYASQSEITPHEALKEDKLG